jgi:alcohol dehydrogenase class IV
MRFEFATATRIVFGAGAVREAGPWAREMGRRALLATGRPPACTASLAQQLGASGIDSIHFPIDSEPTLDVVREGIRRARAEGCDLVIGFGGGSSIDAGKAIAALLTNEGDLLDYLEVIGKGKPLSLPAAPCITIPTTAGTGSEVTRNAVLASPEHRFKASLRSPLMLPRLAIVDPELTYDLPPAVTASTGLDALTQLIEPYVSCRANPMTDAVCLEGIRHAAKSLRRACRNGKDGEARAGMALAGLMGGLALANAGLGVVHGFAAPVGGMFPAPHGAVCAALLPHGMLVNIRALKRDSSRGEAYERYETVARILTGRADAAAEDGAAWVGELCRDLDIPSLRSYGVCESDVGVLVEKASKASSMKGNPIVLSPDELSEVITLAL